MIRAIRRIWDNFRGGGDFAVTVPPMDGALRSNQTLELAPQLLKADRPDNLVSNGTDSYFSSGSIVLRLDPATGETTLAWSFDTDITAMAIAADGSLAIGLAGGRIEFRGGSQDGKAISSLAGKPLFCITTLLFQPSGELIVAQGSSRRTAEQWKHDLMEGGASGSVGTFNVATGAGRLIAEKLAWPSGLAVTSDGKLAVSESWRHRLILLDMTTGARIKAMEDLPGYPGRITPSARGGYWLCVFAPRSQLIEFVLREPEFRERMMKEIAPEYWAAPSLVASHTFLEPLQGGAQIHLGMLKPWAPTRSYGLVVRLNAQFQPTGSFHSRADGRRHGITSCVEAGGNLLASSRGAEDIAILPEHDARVTSAEQH